MTSQDIQPNDVAPGKPPHDGMAWIPGGTFQMGSNDFYPEEKPVHRVSVDGFWMDRHTITVAEFRRFVEETGYVTVAERPLNPDYYPGADPVMLRKQNKRIPVPAPPVEEAVA